LKYLKNLSHPHDLDFIPKVFIIGLPKAGKTTLAEMIGRDLGVVKISIADVLATALERPEGLIAREAN
jgi:adenylate kinase family enzyme